MATHDYIISNASGAAVRADLNNALAAIATNNSSATEPTTTYAYQWWADIGSSPTVMKLRNAANSAWITLFQLDGEWTVVPFENGTAAAPSIYFKDSGTDTGIYSPGTDQVAITTAGVQQLLVDSYGLNTNGGGVFRGGVSSYAVNGGVINFSSPDTQIRACRSGGNYAGMRFYTQGANSSGVQAERMVITTEGLVGIGSNAPQSPLHVNGTGDVAIQITNGTTGTAATDGSQITVEDPSMDLVIRNRESANVRLFTANTERARIDSSGRLLVGTSSVRSNIYKDAFTNIPTAQYETATNTYNNGLTLLNYSGSGYGPVLSLGTSFSNTPGTNTLLVSGGDMGWINFTGNDGTNFRTGASISAFVDGISASGDMPGRLVFSTTADGASSSTERMRIRADGSIEMGKADSGDKLAVLNAASQGVISAYATNASYAATATYVNVSRAANTAYSFIKLLSGDFADTEFHLRGDGNAFADGTWSGGGADYAEYFEWTDGNADEEDRRGISVVLDDDKIRPAAAGEDPIGVISGNPSVVGDAAWNKWSGKYLRDEFGTYIQEDYEVEDEDGNAVVQQRRKLNPAYDPDQEYVSREQRPEWDCVGLMGKLRIRKGQPTGSRWIKMRDISGSVEEWLVR